MLCRFAIMRLQEFEINSIKSAAKDIFGSDLKVTPFGSRVYDDVKGGDLDLYLNPASPKNQTATPIFSPRIL